MSGQHSRTERTEPTLNAKPILERMTFDNVRDTPYVPPPKKPVRYTPWLLLLFVLLCVLAGYLEGRNHFYQSAFWHALAQKLTYQIEPGPSDKISFPAAGPFDKRYGYHQIAHWQEKLQSSGFILSEQSRFSDSLLRYSQFGFNPPYAAGRFPALKIQGCRNDTLYSVNSPAFRFAALQDVAPVIVRTLLFIEDRELLTPDHIRANPVLNLPRLGAAVWSQLQRAAGIPAAAAGGSTLATQLEKYQHSPLGLTSDISEKFNQLVSASVKAYQHSTDTSDARRNIVLQYLNTVPLAASASFGEVHGLGEGLLAWFGRSPAEVNQLLQDTSKASAAKGLALRQVLALFIAQRRPSYYLLKGRADLEQLVSRHLNLLQQQGLISKALSEQALQQKLTFVTDMVPNQVKDADFKASNMARGRLSQLLDQSLYQLDRLDLTARTTLDTHLQQAISKTLKQLTTASGAEQAGLIGHRLLDAGQQDQVSYSFTLYQKSASGNKVRVQTDSTASAFDFNDASKLELGSTAKLRVLISYLEIVAELHRLYAEESPETLRYIEIAPQDNLTSWALSFLMQNPGVSLKAMLQAAVERRYSADPKESFFTGGGLHTFNNFRKEEDKQNPTISEALQQSVNLPFVRLLQDMVSYIIYHGENSSYQLLKDDDNPRREQYLRRFADKEGTTFVRRFWQKYKQKTAEQRLALYAQSSRQTPERLAAAYLYITPDATEQMFRDLMQQHFTPAPDNSTLTSLYKKYAQANFSLPDQAYISRTHPLELWLLRFLQQSPDATLDDAIAQSHTERQDIYQWLFKTRYRSARDNRIRSMLEIEAFWDLHQRWQRLGYPFDYLVPSLATALGSSGDRPSALAELMGIVVNGGQKRPTVRIDQLLFAESTPYHSKFNRPADSAVQVLDADIASTVREMLAQVVSDGTARRLTPIVTQSSIQAIGGKTGTGDNRLVKLNARGQQISSTALNRTATFVFYLNDDYFGVLTAYVVDGDADQFQFTSALPLQVLKTLLPVIQQHLDTTTSCR